MNAARTSTHPPAVVPDRLFDDDRAEDRWRARFRAPRMSLPRYARDAPHIGLYGSNEGGTWEFYLWDRRDGTRRRVTRRRNGTSAAMPGPDGRSIWWFDDTDGDEYGIWMRQPTSIGAPARAALPDVPEGYRAGLQIGRRVTAIGVSGRGCTELFLDVDGRTTRFHRSDDDAAVGPLSRDEGLVAVMHSENGDSRHPAVRVFDTADLAAVADKGDGPGRALVALEFSPRPGDTRLLLRHERGGHDALLVWDVADDREQEIELDLPGDVTATWYPDATALLVTHRYEGRSGLYRYRLAEGALWSLGTPPGQVSAAAVRPDGVVEYSWSSAASPPEIRARRPDGVDEVLLVPRGRRAPRSAPVTGTFVAGRGGPVHVLVSRPPDVREGPLPTVFLLHGGPHAADEDEFSPCHAVWVDAGFAVVRINYRGSTGYGSRWRDAIEGRPGLTEVEDVTAVRDWAVGSGLADPVRCVVAGPSWGGYLTLLALGTRPERWAAGVAAIPIADYVGEYETETEQLRSFDRALFGGGPDVRAALYAECSPITYVAAVTAPVLVTAGDNDPRCPVGQIENYLDGLARNGVRYEFYRYDAGHGSLVTAESVRQAAIDVHFALRAIGRR